MQDETTQYPSDRYSGQLKIDCSHQLCTSHLIRDCNYAISSDNTLFPKQLKKILKETITFKNRYGNEYNPNTKEIFREKERYKERLSNIFKKKPNQTKEETRKLWDSLVYQQKELLLFLEDKNIPSTNNASERALRNRVIKNKVSTIFPSFFIKPISLKYLSNTAIRTLFNFLSSKKCLKF